MNCKYCDDEIIFGPCCNKCQQLYLIISETSMKVVEAIWRDISVSKFMKTVYRRKH